MSMNARRSIHALLRRLRARLSSEEGFTLIAALGVLVVTSALATAAFVAADSDMGLAQHDLQAKQAYYAARAGLNDFMHHLNQDSNYWETCPSQGPTTVPGSPATANETYSYDPVPANSASACDTGNPIPTMIDSQTGAFSMRFTGKAGTPAETRSIVASFRRGSPMDFLWYTVYETLDPGDYPQPWDNDYSQCARWIWDSPSRPGYCSEIDWISADTMKGPMYTQDRYRVCGSPQFGRGPEDKIEAGGPIDPNSISSNGSPLWYSSCGGSQPDMKGTPTPSEGIPLPLVNSRLKVDALSATGMIFGGGTTVQVSGGQAHIYTTQVSTDGVNWTPAPSSGYVVNLNAGSNSFPIIYVDNLPGCTPSYSPYNVTYPPSIQGNPSAPVGDPCGSVYVHGTYSDSFTLAAADDIIVDGDLVNANHNSNSLPAGPAMAGLVANQFVRVMHSCSPKIELNNLEIDAAILALNHSFQVDHYDCGNPLGQLTVQGAIAQRFRGTVGTHNGQSVQTGYAKDYTYDDRLHKQEPPYLFDLQNTSWHIFRETLCVVGSDC